MAGINNYIIYQAIFEQNKTRETFLGKYMLNTEKTHKTMDTVPIKQQQQQVIFNCSFNSNYL